MLAGPPVSAGWLPPTACRCQKVLKFSSNLAGSLVQTKAGSGLLSTRGLGSCSQTSSIGTVYFLL